MNNYRITQSLDSPVYRDALAIREEVFIQEQHVAPEIEIDDKEALCWHIVLYHDDFPVATARILPLEDAVKLQRVAVRKPFRGRQFGLEIMQIALQKAILLGAKKIYLSAQEHALRFYQNLGYRVISDVYLDANIPHYDMVKETSL